MHTHIRTHARTHIQYSMCHMVYPTSVTQCMLLFLLKDLAGMMFDHVMQELLTDARMQSFRY